MRALFPALLLVACAPVQPAPRLAPLDPILAAADALPGQPAFAPSLRAEAEALASRATRLQVPPDPTLEQRVAGLGDRAAAIAAPETADTARLEALQVRAEALRGGGLTDEERERLGSGPSLPAGAGPANSAPDP